MSKTLLIQAGDHQEAKALLDEIEKLRTALSMIKEYKANGDCAAVKADQSKRSIMTQSHSLYKNATTGCVDRIAQFDPHTL